MEKPLILHIITNEKNISPFDVNMALDAGWHSVASYTMVAEDDVESLVQDAIFSRAPSGVKRTGLFIGGRDMFTALKMLDIARKSMVPPFEISVFVDPSGAFTTAAGMISAVERQLAKTGNGTLDGKKVLVLGATGPVGIASGILAGQAGAEVFLISRSLDKAEAVLDRYSALMKGLNVKAGDEQVKQQELASTQVILAAAAAGIQVLNGQELARATSLCVGADVNAVPPPGIAGVEVHHDGAPVAGSPSACGIGALAVGNIKYQAQHRLLKRMYESEKPVYLHFEQACDVARAYGAEKL